MAVLATPSPIFQPAMRIVTGITNANPCVVTTSFANNYFNTDIIRIIVPIGQGFGMEQINGMFGQCTPITATTFSLPIDTTAFDVFVNNMASTQSAQCLAIANEPIPEAYAAEMNTLPTLIRT